MINIDQKYIVSLRLAKDFYYYLTLSVIKNEATIVILQEALGKCVLLSQKHNYIFSVFENLQIISFVVVVRCLL